MNLISFCYQMCILGYTEHIHDIIIPCILRYSIVYYFKCHWQCLLFQHKIINYISWSITSDISAYFHTPAHIVNPYHSFGEHNKNLIINNFEFFTPSSKKLEVHTFQPKYLEHGTSSPLYSGALINIYIANLRRPIDLVHILFKIMWMKNCIDL